MFFLSKFLLQSSVNVIPLVQEGSARSQTLTIVLLESCLTTLIVRILDDQLALWIVRSEQLNLGPGPARRCFTLNITNVGIVHAEDELETCEIIVFEDAGPMGGADVVPFEHVQCTTIGLRANMVASGGGRITKPFVGKASELKEGLKSGSKKNRTGNTNLSSIKCWKTASAMGDRQMLPKQTKRTPRFWGAAILWCLPFSSGPALDIRASMSKTCFRGK